jgi:putative ABC transport system substrate-binding protein
MTPVIGSVLAFVPWVVPLILGILVLSVAPASATSEMPDWFGLTPDVAQRWAAGPDGADRVTVRPRTLVSSGERKQVLVLYSKRSSAYVTAISKILSVFEDKGIDAAFTAVNFHGDGDAGRAALTDARDADYDLVYSMGSAATAFAYKAFRGASIPVVSVCAKDPVLLGQVSDYASGSGNNFAFTSLNVPVEVQLTYLHELRPKLRNIAVLFAHQNKSAVATQLRPLAAVARNRGIQVLEVGVGDRRRAGEELAALVPAAVRRMRETDPDLRHSIFWITGSTSVFAEIATINRFAEAVPVLSVVPDVVRAGGDSAVLSIGVSFESNAHIAAVYGIDILMNGVDPGSLKVGLVSPPDIAINFRRAREIGLKIPFSFFESAGTVYDRTGRIVRDKGKPVLSSSPTGSAEG